MKACPKPTTRSVGLARAISRAGILLALAALVFPARAESGWSRLAKILSPGVPAQRSATPASRPPAAAPAEVAGVPDEQSNGVAGGNQQVAALGQTGGVALPTPTDGGNPAVNQFGKQMDLGLESEDGGALTATDLFKKAEIRRLMGENPRFTYQAGDLQDPMLVPWARNAAIFTELSTLADDFLKQKQFDKAAELYKRILGLNDARYHALALARLGEIAGLNEKARAALAARDVAAEGPVELPAWVHDNTTAVIVSPGQNLCLVGEYMLAVGETLPNYPEVSVAAIDKDKVLYRVKSRTFEVSLTSR
jgi:hypothetical protein